MARIRRFKRASFFLGRLLSILELSSSSSMKIGAIWVLLPLSTFRRAELSWICKYDRFMIVIFWAFVVKGLWNNDDSFVTVSGFLQWNNERRLQFRKAKFACLADHKNEMRVIGRYTSRSPKIRRIPKNRREMEMPLYQKKRNLRDSDKLLWAVWHIQVILYNKAENNITAILVQILPEVSFSMVVFLFDDATSDDFWHPSHSNPSQRTKNIF